MNDSLYQQAIKKLAQSAHGAGRLTQPTVSIRLDNALCGDRIVLDLQIENGVITEVAHETKGCMLCTASASLLAREALGKSSADLGGGLIELEALLGSNSTPSAHWSELSIFVPVRMHKSRYGCVLLPFRALCQAIGKVGL